MAEEKRSVVCNWSSTVQRDTHLQVLYWQPAEKYVGVPITMEGMHRCEECLILLPLRPSFHSRHSLPKSSPHKPSCQGCGWPIGATATPKEISAHMDVCGGVIPARDEYGTLVCPKCALPGLDWNAFAFHVQRCQGDRRKAVDNMREKDITPLKSDAYGTCPRCSHVLSKVVLAETHLCDVKGDPRWFQDPDSLPDRTMPLLSWYRENQMGYGGNSLAGAYPGQMIPKKVADDSYWLPYVTQAPYDATIFKIMNRVHNIKKYLRILPGPASTPQPIAKASSDRKGKGKAMGRARGRAKGGGTTRGNTTGLKGANPDDSDLESEIGSDLEPDTEHDVALHGDMAEDPDGHLGLIDDTYLDSDAESSDSDSDSETDSNWDAADDEDENDEMGNISDAGSERDLTAEYARAVKLAERLGRRIRREVIVARQDGPKAELRYLDKAVLDARESYNQRYLLRYGVTFDREVGGPCPGFSWKHGHFPCPFNVEEVSLRTGYIVMARGGLDTFGVNCTMMFRPNCADCEALSLSYRNWVRASNFDTSGRRICWVLGCAEEAAAGGYCEAHRNEVRDNLLALRARPGRHEKHTWAGKVRRDDPLAVLCHDDNMAFLETVSEARIPYLDDSDDTGVQPWKVIWDAMRRGPDDSPTHAIFFVDTENTLDANGKRTTIELAILDVHGRKLLNCCIDHGVPISTIADKSMWEYALRIYGRKNASQRTKGLSVRRIREKLDEIGLDRNAVILEWSLGSFDTRALQDTFGKDVIPDKGTSLIHPWKALGYRTKTALQVMFPNFFPDEVKTQAHRALPDAVKAFQMTELLLRHYFAE